MSLVHGVLPQPAPCLVPSHLRAWGLAGFRLELALNALHRHIPSACCVPSSMLARGVGEVKGAQEKQPRPCLKKLTVCLWSQRKVGPLAGSMGAWLALSQAPVGEDNAAGLLGPPLAWSPTLASLPVVSGSQWCPAPGDGRLPVVAGSRDGWLWSSGFGP